MKKYIVFILCCCFLSAASRGQDGALDLTFDPGSGANQPVTSVLVLPDGKILIGGSFTSFNGIQRNGIARLLQDGSIDGSFIPGGGVSGLIGSINTMSRQDDGKIVIGGTFTHYDGVARRNVARINEDGTLDASFDPGLGVTYDIAGDFGYVVSSAVLQNGQILVGGGFSEVNGVTRNWMARLNSDGSLDPTFDVGGWASGWVYSISVQPDGQIIVGGGNEIVHRLNTDGSLDPTFSNGTWVTGAATTTLLQPDGKIIIGGDFNSYDGVSRNKIARVNSDGSLDLTFDPGAGATGGVLVYTTALQSDGKIIIGGDFTGYDGVPRSRIARLNSDGSLDLTFDPGAGADQIVIASALQLNGKLIIGGFFSSYGGVPRNNVARINAEQLCSDYVLQLQSDATSPSAVTYEVLDETGTTTVISGNNPVAANAVGSVNLCLADGCYQLRVTDAAGDGLLGYILRESGTGGRRIIDNSRNMNTGVSAIASGGTFCVPIGDDALIHSSCDKLHWALPPNKSIYIVSAANPAVSAEWVPNAPNSQQDANSGYEFWFFDPNGSYSFRTFRSHNTSGGYGIAGPNRACHLRLNGWTNSPSTPHLPSHTLLNVRVRGRVAGVNFEFGPACQFEINPELAACPRVNLQDDPAFSTFSCGVSRNFGGPGSSANRITVDPVSATPTPPSNQVRYQFRFRIPDEDICIVRPPQSSATLTMNWTSGTPLECGKTYDVDVRVSLNAGATWCFGPATTDQAAVCADTEDWGIVCQVTINPCELPEGGGNSMAVHEGELTLYPNPNRSDRLFLNITEVDPDVSTIGIEIYDLTGKIALTRSFGVNEGQLSTFMDLGGQLAGGLYLVHVTAGTKTYTERLLIQP